MQLKRYNALTTRTVHRPTRGETANEVTASRFSVDPATEVFQSPPLALQQTGGRVLRYGARARETTRRRGRRNSSSTFPLALSFLSQAAGIDFRVFPWALCSLCKSLGWLEGERERKKSLFEYIRFVEKCLF